MLRCLAGIQAGVLGGVAMLCYLSADAVLHRQRWSAPAVLLGTVVYGNWAIWHGSAKAILAGSGFLLVLAGIAGVLCAILLSRWPRARTSRFASLAAALAFSLAWYFAWYQIVLPRLAPLIPQYTSRTVAIAAHALLGLLLSRIPIYYCRLDPECEAAPSLMRTSDIA